MNEKELLQQSIETLTEKPVTVTVDRQPKNIVEKLLIRFKLIPSKRKYVLRQVFINNMAKITARIEQLPEDVLSGDNDQIEANLTKLAAKHMEDFIYIIGLGIQNDRHDPTEELLDIIRNEFTTSDFVQVLAPIMRNLKITDFMTSTVLVKGMRILRNQPKENNTGLQK